MLEFANTPISDLAPLRGMPLHNLNLYNCDKLHDLTPLADCKQLENLILPPQPGNIEFLRQHPSLRRMDFQQGGWDTLKPVAEFWKEYDAKKAGKQ
jgi:hypothetical protein